MKHSLSTRVTWIILISLFLLTFLLVTGCGEPNDPVKPDTPELPYDIVDIVSTTAFVNDIDVDTFRNQLVVAFNYSDIGFYDFSDPYNITPVDTLFDEQNSLPAIYISVEPAMDFIAVVNPENYRTYYLDSFTWGRFTKGSRHMEDVITTVRRADILLESGLTLQDTLVAQVITSDTDVGDAFAVDYAIQDTIILFEEVIPRFWIERVATGLVNYAGEASAGLAFYEEPDLVAAGMMQFGIGIADVSPELVAGFEGNGEWISFADTPGEATHLAVQDGWIFAADGYMGLAIIDATDMHNPEYVSSWKTDGLDHAIDVAVFGDVVALMDEYDGVYFIDVSVPEAPEYLGQYELREPNSVMFTDDGYLLIASDYEGITVLTMKD